MGDQERPDGVSQLQGHERDEQDHSARDQDHAGRIQGDLFLFLDRDFLGSVDSLQRFPKAALIPGTSAASPSTPASSVANDNRCTGEGDDDESLPTSSPELTMIHDMLKSAHTQLITMNARDYGFVARSPD